MIEISRHIEILLLDNDCVIVPGLGGFVAHYSSAEYLENQGLFIPPVRTIGFNPQLQLNDSLLAQSYVEAYDISFPEAVRKIETEVEVIRQCLNVEGVYDFAGIGVLEQTGTDHYDFHPSASGLLTPSLYGFNSLPISEIESSISTIEVDITPLKALTVLRHDSVRLLSKATTAAIAAVMLCLFTLCSIPVGTGSADFQQCSVLNTQLITNIVKSNVEDLMLADSVAAVDSNKELLTDVKVNNQKTASATRMFVSQPKEHYYVLVLAAKVSKAGANDLVQKLRKCGFSDISVCEKTSTRKVIYGHYGSESEAHHALQCLRNQDSSFTDAWISRI